MNNTTLLLPLGHIPIKALFGSQGPVPHWEVITIGFEWNWCVTVIPERLRPSLYFISVTDTSGDRTRASWSRCIPSHALLPSAWVSFHESGADFSISRGKNGNGGVWVEVSFTSGITEHLVTNGPGLNPSHTDPRVLTGVGPHSLPGWG
jgi:hypothetical protein